MYESSPLDRHYDNGFGAIADSFKEAATELKASYHRVKTNGHLPIAYLYRHSIELYLKGLIITIHKRIKRQQGLELCFPEPKIPQEDGHPETMYSIHDISILYSYASSLFLENKLDEVTGLNNVFGSETGSKVERIKGVDPKSQFFRYPTNRSKSHEKEKSALKETTYKEVVDLALKNNKPVTSIRTAKLAGRDVQVFVHDDSFTASIIDDLSDVAETLELCHSILMRSLGEGF